MDFYNERTCLKAVTSNTDVQGVRDWRVPFVGLDHPVYFEPVWELEAVPRVVGDVLDLVMEHEYSPFRLDIDGFRNLESDTFGCMLGVERPVSWVLDCVR